MEVEKEEWWRKSEGGGVEMEEKRWKSMESREMMVMNRNLLVQLTFPSAPTRSLGASASARMSRASL